MPAKKQNPLFTTEANTSDSKKLPTLRQFLKEHKDAGINNSYRIEVIWFPGKYPNYNLQTTHFRASVSEGSKLYQALRSNLDEFTKTRQGLFIRFDEQRREIYTLVPDMEPGEWFFISDIGVRWEPDNDRGNDNEPL